MFRLGIYFANQLLDQFYRLKFKQTLTNILTNKIIDTIKNVVAEELQNLWFQQDLIIRFV